MLRSVVPLTSPTERSTSRLNFDANIETIAEIGHGGEYMTADQTFDYFEDEVWYPELIDRGSYSKWLAGDQRTFNERLHAKTAKILAEHPSVEFPPEVVAEMDRICDAAMKRVGA